MKIKFSLFILGLILNTQSSFCQDLPIIQANSKLVSIQEGDILTKGSWTIMPEYKPDIFTSNSKGKMVTFYTDIDSISFKVKPNVVHDFHHFIEWKRYRLHSN